MNDRQTIGETGGEFAFIDRALAQAARGDQRIIVGPGDDAAVLRCGGEAVVTTDLLIEGRHFRLDWIAPFDAGWRAAISSLSDLAAMGARPLAGFLSLGVGPQFPAADAEDLVRGVAACLEIYGAALAGGDTVASSSGVILNVCLAGEWQGRSCLRSAARPGDLICVTGRLGGSRAALRLLERLGPQAAWEGHHELILSYSAPHARTSAGLWLTRQDAVHAMMDISDGLSSDLWRIAEASGVRCVVDVSALPVSPAAAAAAHLTGETLADTALHGGEDFELLFTIAPEGAEAVLGGIVIETGTQAAIVGRVDEGEPGVFAADGAPIHPAFEHFAP